MIQSMTKEERRHPERIRSTMKKRIAAGSGTTLSDVNRLLKQWEKTKKAMDMIGSMSRNNQLTEDNAKKMMENAQKQLEEYRKMNRH